MAVTTSQDWTTYELGQLFDFSNGINAGKSAYGRGVPFINVFEVINSESLQVRDIPGRVTLPNSTLARYQVRRGDVLLNRTSETLDEVGLSSVYLGEEPVVFGGFVFRARPKTKYLDINFSKYRLRGADIRRQITARGQGGIRSNLGQRDLKAVVVTLPDITEQQAIAEVLDDASALVHQLRQLVAKRRAIKQGMMQDLLTGRTRLPGFSGVWVIRKIGTFADVKAGGTPSTSVSRYWGGRKRWMSSGEVHQKRIREVKGRITCDGLRESAAQLLPVGTVLMALAGQGKTRGTVAVSEVELSTNQSIAGILPSSEHDSDFLYYNLDTRYEELRGESAGDGGRGGLNLTIIKKLDVRMPPVPEQRAIAQVLSDTDAEIEALERRLEATRAIKQGMMQELLTGRTRLASTDLPA